MTEIHPPPDRAHNGHLEGAHRPSLELCEYWSLKNKPLELLSEVNMVRSPPRFSRTALPPEEHDAVRVLENLLCELENYARAFQAALRLYNFSSGQGRQQLAAHRAQGGSIDDSTELSNMLSEWGRIAARDGAMSIYHFYKAMEGIRDSIGSSPTLLGLVDISTLRYTVKLFKSKFPYVERMRNALAHAAEFRQTVQKDRRNTARGKQKGFGYDSSGPYTIIQNSIIHGAYTATYEGQIIKYDISDESLNQMLRAKDAFYNAFRTAETRSCEAAQVQPGKESETAKHD